MLHLYQSNNLCDLAKHFVDSTKEKRDPFRSDIVITQTKGMERWLMLQYAKHESVVAGFDFQTPVQFLMKLHFLLAGEHEQRNIFERDVMPWALIDIVERNWEHEELSMLRHYLGAEGTNNSRKLYGLCKQISNLYDQYMIYRPELLQGWVEDRRVFQQSNHREYENWQAFLWRELYRYREATADPGREGLNLVELFDSLNSLIREMDSEAVSRVIPRLSLFGMSLLPPRYIETFDLLSDKIPVSLFLLNPSREYWFDIYSDRAVSKLSEKIDSKGKDSTLFHLGGGNRLLANLGKTGADFFYLIYDREPEVDGEYEPEHKEENTLLEMIQGDILFCRDSVPQRVITSDDSSIEVFSCHSSLREVETVQDAILKAFEMNPQLLPSDILVVSPNIEEYAPFIEQVFSSTASTCGVPLPYTIADLSYGKRNPLAEFVIEILKEVEGRFEASKIVALFDEYCALIGKTLQEEERGTLKKWILETGIRWGLDENHRKAEGLPLYDTCSWKKGVERLLLGYMMGGDSRFAGYTLPYTEIEGGGANLLGIFLNFFHLLELLANLRSESKRIDEWQAIFIDLMEKLFEDRGDVEGVAELFKIVGALSEPAKTAAFMKPVSLSLFRTILADTISMNDTTGAFLNGAITFASMIPMRSIPFKMIVMMGMNIDAFPRKSDRCEFDLMRVAGFHKRGDRNQRNSDLYLFLEILISAEEKLLLTYCGRDNKDNSPLPASLTVEFLLDYVGKNFTTEHGEVSLVREQFLQPFSGRYSIEEGVGTYNKSWFTQVKALTESNPFEWIRDEEIDSTHIDGNELLTFFNSPVDYFFREACRIEKEQYSDDLPDKELLELRGLDRYTFQSTYINTKLSGESSDEIQLEMEEAGLVPIEMLGRYSEIKQGDEIQRFLQRITKWCTITGEATYSINRKIHGVSVQFVRDVYQAETGERVIIIPGSLKGKYELDFWISHLFFNLEESCDTLLISRDSSLRLQSLESNLALHTICTLYSFYCSGRARQALPFFPDASLDYYRRTTLKKGRKDPLVAAWDLIKPASFGYQSGTAYFELFPASAESLDDLGIAQSFKDITEKVLAPYIERLVQL